MLVSPVQLIVFLKEGVITVESRLKSVFNLGELKVLGGARSDVTSCVKGCVAGMFINEVW